jgi:hypothetical protein
MLIKACNEITRISDTDEAANSENYIAALGYISNLYRFIDTIKDSVPSAAKVRFLPTFIDRYVGDKYKIASTEEENEMRLFKMVSPMIGSDPSLASEIKEAADPICSDVSIDGEMITFILRDPSEGKK